MIRAQIEVCGHPYATAVGIIHGQHHSKTREKLDIPHAKCPGLYRDVTLCPKKWHRASRSSLQYLWGCRVFERWLSSVSDILWVVPWGLKMQNVKTSSNYTKTMVRCRPLSASWTKNPRELRWACWRWSRSTEILRQGRSHQNFISRVGCQSGNSRSGQKCTLGITSPILQGFLLHGHPRFHKLDWRIK